MVLASLTREVSIHSWRRVGVPVLCREACRHPLQWTNHCCRAIHQRRSSWVEQHEEPWYQENEGGLTEPKEHTESETESPDTEDDGI